MNEGVDSRPVLSITRGFRHKGKFRKPRSPLACTRCRKRKIRCDGTEDKACTSCDKAGNQCTYLRGGITYSMEYCVNQRTSLRSPQSPFPSGSSAYGSFARGAAQYSYVAPYEAALEPPGAASYSRHSGYRSDAYLRFPQVLSIPSEVIGCVDPAEVSAASSLTGLRLPQSVQNDSRVSPLPLSGSARHVWEGQYDQELSEGLASGTVLLIATASDSLRVYTRFCGTATVITQSRTGWECNRSLGLKAEKKAKCPAFASMA